MRMGVFYSTRSYKGQRSKTRSKNKIGLSPPVNDMNQNEKTSICSSYHSCDIKRSIDLVSEVSPPNRYRISLKSLYLEKNT